MQYYQVTEELLEEPDDLARWVPGRDRRGATAEASVGGQILMAPGNYWFSAKFAWLNDRYGVSWPLNLSH